MPEKKTFKPFWKTCEFISTVIFVGLVSWIFRHDIELACEISTAVVCAYIIARALFKKNRADLILSGERTSEFGWYLVWLAWLTFCVWHLGLNPIIGLICGAITQVCFVLARGYTKGHSAVRATVVSL